MYKRLFLFVPLLTLLFSCKNTKEPDMENHNQFTNALINETSPYLLQHAHNPVNWYPWNDETLELAKKENKLLLISVGYAACHWCHVMERESFEDSTVAALMNENFINVKVDREERPDVDQIYMNAVQLLTGSGGWPLNCVALPDGRPIWGGTYFPKENWINALTQLADLYKNEPEKAQDYATKLTEGVKQTGLIELNEEEAVFDKSGLDLAIENWLPTMDQKNGGRKGAPKFPMPGNLSFLLRYAVQNNDQEMMNYVNTSLTQIAYGGIFDHVGGGFARYSVDDHWHVPHFEKMLYDNAQMVSLYSNAYLVTKDALYKEVVYRTIDFVEAELYKDIGAFYSSLDADSYNEEGELEEGAFYVWTKNELQTVLQDDFELFSKYYNINGYGKWEDDKYHLIRSISNAQFSEENDVDEAEIQLKLKKWQEILSEERNKRDRPRLDDKTLTSWNALMLKGYIDAFRVFQEDRFLEVALKNARFLQTKMIKEDGGLYRNFKNDRSNIEAYLEDYATVIDAYISLYEVTLDEKWLQNAKQLTDYSFDHFYNEESKMFFFTSDMETGLITRKVETDDNVIPSSNSIMANNLFKLGHYFANKYYSENAVTMLNNVKEMTINYGAGASNWLNLYSNFIGEYYEVAIVGPEALDKLKALNQVYIPNKMIIGSQVESNLPLLEYKFNENETTIYVCINGACKLPVSETEKALEQINRSF
ncbi:thioredoxin domain-containing protein [Lutimonas zeaxanthinifaciens]|uniref:thioredoxin domain-containing protein n=1 Tax=Lutimonas zeaxanthinifaciens TaxID=3060215 RepID=UPI00265D4AA5|nr:thioredoxin domain-containing protein [Lutimonas sp. YSD2104]WKK66368.1 thioredoxin domain-containing protein [Lutimonas sp. YSD2104]